MSRSLSVLLLNAPNWSSVVGGPQLGTALVAGACHAEGFDVQTWDLSWSYYGHAGVHWDVGAVLESVRRNDYRSLDAMYFEAEERLTRAGGHGWRFRALSGYSPADGYSDDIRILQTQVEQGTPFTSFFYETLAPRLYAARADVVGLSVTSANQFPFALELAGVVRAALPGAILVIGGNTVTRLRDTAALARVRGVCDYVVFFQGEAPIRFLLRQLASGAEPGSTLLSGDSVLTDEEWPAPTFTGIDLDSFGEYVVLPVVTTRGCYWSGCSFCAIPYGWAPSGYAGSLDVGTAVAQLRHLADATGVLRYKLVNESLSPTHADKLAQAVLAEHLEISWEAYIRLDSEWECPRRLAHLAASGCRKLYVGLEQVPSESRGLLTKRDTGNPTRILTAAREAGVKLHLFTMVGFPGTTALDAERTTDFLLEHQDEIDTADVMGFRLERGLSVPGILPRLPASDWRLALDYNPTDNSVLVQEEVAELEAACQERVWSSCPRLLHPLYRLVSPWAT